MRFEQLVAELRDTYNTAIRGQKIVMLEVFVIKHADDIISQEIKPVDLLREAGLAETMVGEVNRALNLSKYVVVREEFR